LNLVLLSALLGIVGLCGRDALRDRTPRKPFVWARPELEWWAIRRSVRESRRHAVRMARGGPVR
jgi:hypothetical protein